MSAIEKLYDRYKFSIFRYLHRLVGDYHVAEELTQETFYRACVSLKNFRGESSLSTWLFRIAFYVYTGYLRTPRNFYIPLDRDISDDSDKGNPVRALEEADSWRLTKMVLQQLPVNYRTVIVLREMEGLSFEEIGTILDKSPSTVRVTLCRARQKFRLLFNQMNNIKGFNSNKNLLGGGLCESV